MSLPQAKFRELVFQLLFALENGSEEEDLIPLLMKELKSSQKNVLEGLTKAKAVLRNLEEIDEKIAASSQEYAIDRIHKVEKNVLRLSLYELLYEKSNPCEVIISEAIRLTKKFGTPDGSRFVHAILDASTSLSS